MENPKVLVGKEDWLFLQNDTNRIVEQNVGLLKFSPEDVKRWVSILESRNTMLEDRGIKYYFFVAPNKESIYPEYLPEGYLLSEQRPIHQITEALLASSVKLLYPLEVLKSYKAKLQLYTQVNTHWNASGAYIAYEYLANSIKKDYAIKVVDWEDIIFEDSEISEDLGDKLNPPQTSTYVRARVNHGTAQIIYDNGIKNSGRIQISQNKDSTLPNAMIFHDSFMTEGMFPFIMESFSRVQFIHTPIVDFNLIDQLKPDVVISEMVERFIISIPSG